MKLLVILFILKLYARVNIFKLQIIILQNKSRFLLGYASLIHYQSFLELIQACMMWNA